MSRPKLNLQKILLAKLPREKKFLVAVSGGKDSVSLLHACAKVADLLSATFEVAHIDHGIRHNSKSDAEFVKNLALSYGFSFHLKQIEKAPTTGNLEAWGRELRYTFFAEVLEKNQIDYLLTAHTADDAAETLLMRLIANKEVAGIFEQDEKRHCLRPFLNLPRTAIEEYVQENNLEFREDYTNSDISYSRNRVRHLVMPVLRDNFDKRISEVLAYRASCIQEDTLFLRSLLSEPLAHVKEKELFSRAWLRAVKQEFAQLPIPLKWRFAEELLLPFLGYRLGRLHGKRAAEFLCGATQGVELPNGITLRAKSGGVAVAGK